MGRIQHLSNSTSSSAMDIDPRSSSWNSLCPSYIDSRRIRLQDESSGNVIGSPPPAGPPKILWDDNMPLEVPNVQVVDGAAGKDSEEKISPMETSELSLRVQGIRLQPPPQPIIICETVEDDKVEANEMVSSDAVSLTVPPVDVTNEKKRPPLSAPY